MIRPLSIGGIGVVFRVVLVTVFGMLKVPGS